MFLLLLLILLYLFLIPLFYLFHLSSPFHIFSYLTLGVYFLNIVTWPSFDFKPPGNIQLSPPCRGAHTLSIKVKFSFLIVYSYPSNISCKNKDVEGRGGRERERRGEGRGGEKEKRRERYKIIDRSTTGEGGEVVAWKK